MKTGFDNELYIEKQTEKIRERIALFKLSLIHISEPTRPY